MKWLNGSPRKDLHWQRTPLSQNAFAGERIAVIGGTNGIGRAIAHELVAKGAEVTVLGRTFLDKDVAGLHFMQADLTQMKQARCVAEELPVETFDMLIFTTGILAGKQRLETPEGMSLPTRIRVAYYSSLPQEGVPAQVRDRPSETGAMAFRGKETLWPVHLELHGHFQSHPSPGVGSR